MLTNKLVAMAQVTIGVLALQGAFREHIQRLNSIEGVSAVAVRTGVRTYTAMRVTWQ